MTFCCNAVIKSITNKISVILYPLHLSNGRYNAHYWDQVVFKWFLFKKKRKKWTTLQDILVPAKKSASKEDFFLARIQ